MAGLLQIARARIAVHALELHQVHHVEAVVDIAHGDGVEGIRAAGNAVNARIGKEGRRIAGEAIQLVSAIVGQVPSSLGELTDVVILVEVGVVEGVGALRAAGERRAARFAGRCGTSELLPADAFAPGPLCGEYIAFVGKLKFNARQKGYSVSR